MTAGAVVVACTDGGLTVEVWTGSMNTGLGLACVWVAELVSAGVNLSEVTVVVVEYVVEGISLISDSNVVVDPCEYSVCASIKCVAVYVVGSQFLDSVSARLLY